MYHLHYDNIYGDISGLPIFYIICLDTYIEFYNTCYG